MVQALEVVDRPLHISCFLYLSTKVISKLERSRKVNCLQLQNILHILVTFEVLKLDRLRLVKPLQFINIPPSQS